MFSGDEVSSEEHKKGVQELFARIIDLNESKLDCENHGLTSEELEELADILKSKTFSELDLGYNEINAAGMEALQKIILSNPHLKIINLEANKIDDEAILKLIENEEVRKRLPTMDIRLTMNPIRETGLIEGAKCMSVLTVTSMTRGTHIKDEDLLHKYRSTIANYLKSEAKEDERQSVGFFKILKEDEFKDPTQANKLKNIDGKNTTPTRKNS